MPVEPVVTLIAVAVAVNLAVMALVVIPPLAGRRSPLTSPESASMPALDEHAAEIAAVAGIATESVGLGGISRRAYDRIVRMVAWGFILAAMTIVGISGLWRDVEPAIFVLLGVGGVILFVVHDVVPERLLGPAKFVIEASVALTFASLLVVLTGRAESPFFYAYPLIVGGAALVVSPRVTLILVSLAALAYVLAVTVGPDAAPATPEEAAQTAAIVAIHLTALFLIVYVASVVAREQRRARDAALRLSTVDPLTGLFNRTFFFAAVDREIARSARTARGFGLLLMDLDDLKRINDQHGHHEGDRVLRGVGDVIARQIRRTDTACRYGGDEFVVLLPETDAAGARVVAEKIRTGTAGLTLPETTLRPSLSVGVVRHPEDGVTADELLIRADAAMYAGKRAGKDRVFELPRDGAATPGAATPGTTPIDAPATRPGEPPAPPV